MPSGCARTTAAAPSRAIGTDRNGGPAERVGSSGRAVAPSPQAPGPPSSCSNTYTTPGASLAPATSGNGAPTTMVVPLTETLLPKSRHSRRRSVLRLPARPVRRGRVGTHRRRRLARATTVIVPSVATVSPKPAAPSLGARRRLCTQMMPPGSRSNTCTTRAPPTTAVSPASRAGPNAAGVPSLVRQRLHPGEEIWSGLSRGDGRGCGEHDHGAEQKDETIRQGVRSF